MARQKSVIKIEGSIGDLSFYKSGGQYLAREKGGVSAERIKKDPAFARTRENGAEFGRAGKAGKELRGALNQLLNRASDNKVTSRLATKLLAAIKADTTNRRGERTVIDGDLGLLQGFEFNGDAKLESVIKVGYTVAFDRAAGTAQVAIEEFDPSQEVPEVEGATHVRIRTATAAVDFENQQYEVEVQDSPDIELNSNAQAALELDTAVTAETQLPVFVVMGAEYFQEVNGQLYPLQSKSNNPLAIVGLYTV